MIYVWDMLKGETLRELSVSSFILRLCLTPLGKFVSFTLLDGTLLLYETLTGIVWRTENIDGKHSGVAIALTNYVMEVA